MSTKYSYIRFVRFALRVSTAKKGWTTETLTNRQRTSYLIIVVGGSVTLRLSLFFHFHKHKHNFLLLSQYKGTFFATFLCVATYITFHFVHKRIYFLFCFIFAADIFSFFFIILFSCCYPNSNTVTKVSLSFLSFCIFVFIQPMRHCHKEKGDKKLQVTQQFTVHRKQL